MTDRRLALSALLHTFTDNVYYQEPENTKMAYPAILYRPDYEERSYADNLTYGLMDRWQVTIIDEDPDSALRQAFRMLGGCAFDRHFRTEGLNHFIYTLYF